MSTDTPITEALIAKVMAQYPGVSKMAEARYYEEVHQELAPLARAFEKRIAALEAENARLKQQPSDAGNDQSGMTVAPRELAEALQTARTVIYEFVRLRKLARDSDNLNCSGSWANVHKQRAWREEVEIKTPLAYEAARDALEAIDVALAADSRGQAVESARSVPASEGLGSVPGSPEDWLEPTEEMRHAVYMALHYYMNVQNPNEWEATDKAIAAMIAAAPKVKA